MSATTDTATASTEPRLLFLPLGGCGEIGMNLNLYGFGPEGEEEWLMVDLGVTFGDLTTPGIDLIMPDPSYIAERRKRLHALVLTHGHEDHIGAAAHLWPDLKCPVYATPFTAALVREKFAENGILNEVPLHVIPLNAELAFGAFELKLITLTHSILEPNAISIRTPLGTVLHTGDWKIDPEPLIGETTDEEALRRLGEEGVLAMVCDSTNVFSPGTAGSEGQVRDRLTDVIGTLTGRVAVTTFASNVARLESVMKAAAAHDRHVVLVGRSMHRITQAAREAGYLKDVPDPISDEDAGYLPKDKVLFLCTGSQGESRAALARIAEGSHQTVTLEEGDTVIFSSRVIPGNEKEIFALQNTMVAQGIDVITEKDEPIHVSGHPNRDELAAMYGWVRPRISVPVHGEARHLREHAAFAKELQVPEAVVPSNGSLIRLAPGPAEVIEHVDAGRLFLDGNRLIQETHPAVALRRRLAFAGHITVALVLEDGDLVADPLVRCLGVPEFPEENLEAEFEDTVDGALRGLSKKDRLDDWKVEEAVRRALRPILKTEWGKRPPIEVDIIRLE